jgi:hypothetical protein
MKMQFRRSPAMTPQQLENLERQLQTWREAHRGVDTLRAAYRQKILAFTLSTMAMEREPVEMTRLQSLLSRPDH